jgi:hypothetical protein
MVNLLDNRRRSERSDQKASWRHFSSEHRGKDRIHLFLQDLSKKKTLSTGRSPPNGIVGFVHEIKSTSINNTSSNFLLAEMILGLLGL